VAEAGSESTAIDFLSHLLNRLNQVLQFPFSGAPRPDLAHDLRVIFHERYAVYYLPRNDDITVVRVLHGSRDIASIADKDGFAI
jgi:toxin ParE1/3/4